MSICCCKILSAISVQIVGASIVITTVPKILGNKNRYLLQLGCIPFPNVTPGTNPPVVVSNNGVTLPLQDCIGNLVRASDIGACRQWLVAFGNDATPHITVLRGVKNTRQCPICNEGYTPAVAVV